MDSLEAAGGRFDEALGQMQKSVQTFAERVRVAHQKSDDDLRKASQEIAPQRYSLEAFVALL